ncbi:MAG: DUF2029 domain-containing protein, partial [Deltaproteobacteria bacterium]|nr:DUF2029 domain-containing protein [Deltaproteobacteria bacterium]
PFAYPAFYAALLAPLGLLPPAAAKAAFGALMLLCALAGLLAGCRLHPAGVRRWPEAAALMFALVPLDLSIAGGQNTALSLLLCAAAMLALRQGSRRHDILAGALLGLWLFKPHFGLLAIGLALAARRWWVLAGALPMALLLYALGAAVFGPDWIGAWLSALGDYIDRDYLANQHQMVCLVGAAHAIGSALALEPFAGQTLVAAAWSISALLVALCAWRLWRASGAAGHGSDRADAACAWCALIGPLAVLTSPHTVAHDLPLALLPALLAVRFERDREVNAVALIWIAVAACTLFKDALLVSPLALVSLGTVLWLAWHGAARCSVDPLPR